MSINKVMVSGNLTRDCELRNTAGGTAVAVFTVACNTRRKNGDNWEDYPNFFKVTLWGKVASAIAPRLVKGAKVALDGRLHYSTWEKDGQKHSSVEIIADNVELLTAPKNEQQQLPFDDGYSDIPF